MIALRLGGLRSVLAIGAHSDDIEIGCGGTLLAIARANPGCAFTWLVLTGDDARCAEARASAAAFLPGVAPRLVLGGLRDGHLPYADASAGKDLVHRVRDEAAPDLVLTHRRADMHQDHRFCGDVAHQAFRGVLTLEYEIPKYDGDLGVPNLLVPVEEDAARRKVDHLMAHFATQRAKGWFTEDTFLGLMRLRGIEAASDSGFAEGFDARKLIMLP
ncbi:MAG: PIG-L family deacetylase [Thermoleophilia bacterium]|nr:PIG-L family deacetylase [Thermoleophilia bacterium]